MLYNQPIVYNEPNFSYSGTLIIYAQSLSSPIVLNNITILIGGQEDYSNYSTIAVISMDVSSTGVVSIEVLDENVSAIVSAETVALGDGEISIIS
jgi:hypothetical protein